MLRVRHLNCGTLRPVAGRLFGAPGDWGARGEMVCHCLLIESGRDVVLVDTGFGRADCDDPGRLGGAFVKAVGPLLDRHETAYLQVLKLGLSPSHITHIVMTHMDLDHAGGLRDFPDATVWLSRTEHAHASRRALLPEKLRYLPDQWTAATRFSPVDVDTASFFGVPASAPLPGLDALLLVDLAGHSAGHVGVAVRDGDQWLLHAGDAFFDLREITDPAAAPIGPRAFGRLVGADETARQRAIAHLRRIHRDHGDRVRIVCTHDAADFARLAAAPWRA